MQKIKLYHISYDLTEPLEKEFVPKIPNNAATGEDESIPRICFCDSIERCLNAAEDNFGDYEVADKATIIVWENEFSLFDEKLLSWQHLYENNLVPDAALTHEYWYLDKLQIAGNYYEIRNINDAIANKRLVYIIKPKYKEKVLQLLLKNGIDTTLIKELDLYTLINEWLPRTHPNVFDSIVDALNKEIRIANEENESSSEYDKIFDEPLRKNTMLDIDSQKIYHHLSIVKI